MIFITIFKLLHHIEIIKLVPRTYAFLCVDEPKIHYEEMDS